MQQHAIALQTNFGGQLHRVGHVIRVDFARTAELIQPAALRAADSHAADAHGDALHRNLCAAFGIHHRRANRFGQRHLIGNASLRPPGRRRQAVRKIADVISVQRADDAPRSGTTGVQAHGELRS
jgi:hypothetical protein